MHKHHKMEAKVLVIPVRVINRGGDADQHRIRAAEAAEMYAGLGRLLVYPALTLIEGKLALRATKRDNIQLYLTSSHKASSIEHIWELIINFPLDTLRDIPKKMIVDFAVQSIKEGVGKFLLEDKNLLPERVEPYFSELIDKMEPHQISLHKPITSESEKIEIIIDEQEIITLDHTTKDYVTSKLSSREEQFSGIITRYNILTKNGRIQCDDFDRVMSFSRSTKFDDENRVLSWSLNEAYNNRQAEIIVSARRKITESGRTTRIIVLNATKAQ